MATYYTFPDSSVIRQEFKASGLEDYLTYRQFSCVDILLNEICMLYHKKTLAKCVVTFMLTDFLADFRSRYYDGGMMTAKIRREPESKLKDIHILDNLNKCIPDFADALYMIAFGAGLRDISNVDKSQFVTLHPTDPSELRPTDPSDFKDISDAVGYRDGYLLPTIKQKSNQIQTMEQLMAAMKSAHD